MVFHHIGIATADIEFSKQAYSQLGYVGEEIIYDPIQKVVLCFLNKPNAPIIELVSPTEESSPVKSILKKNGTIPYHTCFEVMDLEENINKLKKSKFILIVKPVPAIAFSNRRICFLYNRDTGLIELLEKVHK